MEAYKRGRILTGVHLVNASRMMSNLIYCHAYFSISKAFKIILTKLTTIAPPKAGQNPIITNPVIKEEVNPNMIALIINVNNPKERIFNGSVNIIKIGLIEILSNPNIIEAISKSLKSSNNIPGKIKLAAPKDIEFINQRITAFLNNFIS